MKTIKSVLCLFLLMLLSPAVQSQSSGALAITTSPTATTADYDKVVAALKTNGLWDSYWSFHAMGQVQPAGLFGIGVYPSREAYEKRSEAVRPVFAEAGAKPNVEVFDIYNSFTGTVPDAVPAAGIVVHFNAKGMTTAQYDQILVQLKETASFPPPGQIGHVCYQSAEGLKVVDVWESAEAFAAMGEKLMPILQGLGVDAGEPVVYKLYNCVKTNN